MFIEQWADYKVCGVCGRGNEWDDYDWPDEDICPGCRATEDQAAVEVAAEGKKEGMR